MNRRNIFGLLFGAIAVAVLPKRAAAELTPVITPLTNSAGKNKNWKVGAYDGSVHFQEPPPADMKLVLVYEYEQWRYEYFDSLKRGDRFIHAGHIRRVDLVTECYKTDLNVYTCLDDVKNFPDGSAVVPTSKQTWHTFCELHPPHFVFNKDFL